MITLPKGALVLYVVLGAGFGASLVNAFDGFIGGHPVTGWLFAALTVLWFASTVRTWRRDDRRVVRPPADPGPERESAGA